MLNLKYPEVRRFHYAAELHYDSASRLFEDCVPRESSQLGHEVIYLGGYVVECLFKVLYLSRCARARHDEIVGWLKAEVGHNLERLRVELGKKGVVFPKQVLLDLRAVNTNWNSEMRYSVHRWTYEDTSRFHRSVGRIRLWIQGG